jgi:hypothetical protein
LFVPDAGEEVNFIRLFNFFANPETPILVTTILMGHVSQTSDPEFGQFCSKTAKVILVRKRFSPHLEILFKIISF